MPAPNIPPKQPAQTPPPQTPSFLSTISTAAYISTAVIALLLLTIILLYLFPGFMDRSTAETTATTTFVTRASQLLQATPDSSALVNSNLLTMTRVYYSERALDHWNVYLTVGTNSKVTQAKVYAHKVIIPGLDNPTTCTQANIPYQTTEQYEDQEPYTTQEAYTTQEPYLYNETYTNTTLLTKSGAPPKDLTLVAKQSGICPPTATLYNPNNGIIDFNIVFTTRTTNPPKLYWDVRSDQNHTIAADDTLDLQGTCYIPTIHNGAYLGDIQNNSLIITMHANSYLHWEQHTEQREVMAQRDVIKYRTVTNYRPVTKTRTITQYRTATICLPPALATS